MSKTGAAAVNTMVKARFDTTNFTRIVRAPEHGPIDILKDEIAKVAATFKTTWYGGRTGCLALIVDEEEMQRVTKDGTLDCTCTPNPPLLSPRLSDTTTATDGKTFAADHQQVWFEYYLDQAVDIYSVAAIVTSTDTQYLAELEMDYVGFAEDTTQMMLAHLSTQPVVLNKEKRVLRRYFFRSWSDSPNMNLQEFACQLDKHQRKAKKINITIDDDDKVVHLVGCAQNLELFEAEWVEKWEVVPKHG